MRVRTIRPSFTLRSWTAFRKRISKTKIDPGADGRNDKYDQHCRSHAGGYAGIELPVQWIRILSYHAMKDIRSDRLPEQDGCTLHDQQHKPEPIMRPCAERCHYLRRDIHHLSSPPDVFLRRKDSGGIESTPR